MQRQSLVLSSCLLLLLVGAAAWVLRDDTVRAPEGSAASAPQPAPATDRSVPVPTAATAPPPVDRALAEQAPEVLPPQEPTGNRQFLYGTVTVLEADGRELTDGAGELELELLTPLGRQSYGTERKRVPVRNGRWEASVSTAVELLQAGEVRLDRRFACCTDQIDLLTVELPLALHATWLPALRLRVLGDDTGADLTGIRVVEKADWMDGRWLHPGGSPAEPVLVGARSPLLLQATVHREHVRYWVTAPGYAWGGIDIATADPDERVLRLRPGGDVDLTILGPLPEGGGAVVRVRPLDAQGSRGELPPDSAPITECHARTGNLRLDKLPPGSWSVSVEQGPWLSGRRVLGHAAVTVAAGALVSASVTLPGRPEKAPLVSVQGTLRLSPRWGADINLILRPSQSHNEWTNDRAYVYVPLSEMLPIGSDTYRWGPHELAAGRWQVLVSGTGHRMIVDFGPGLANDPHIEVQEPSDVRIRVVDALSGEPIRGAEPVWFSMVQGQRGDQDPADMTPVAGDWFHARAPTGKVQVHVHPKGYAWHRQEYEVRPGSNEFVVHVPRACGVEIVLRHAGVVLRWPDATQVELTHTTTKARSASWSGHKVTAREPGDHRLIITDVPGFEPIEPRTVRIEPGQWTRVEIDLQDRE